MRFLLFLFFFAGVGIAVAEEGEPRIPQPRIDERVELLGIVFRLAGAQEYQVALFKEYDDAINEHFSPLKKHPVVGSASLLRRMRGIGYNAIVDCGIHISLENGHVVCPDADSEKTLEKIDFRWKPEMVRVFAKQLDDFYVKSRFHEFFASNREMYRKMEEKIEAINDKIDYSWFKSFYGDADLEHFHVILNCTSENSGYGAVCRFKDGHDEYFAILGVNGPDVSYSEDGFIAFTIHEFNHSFCNPLVKKHLDALKPAAERVFPFVSDMMVRQHYGAPEYMLNEYLVRACEIRYFLTHDKKDMADKMIPVYRSLGFLWIAELVERLGRYEQERDKYPTLDDFMPEIVRMQNTLVTDEYIAAIREQKEKQEVKDLPKRAGDEGTP